MRNDVSKKFGKGGQTSIFSHFWDFPGKKGKEMFSRSFALLFLLGQYFPFFEQNRARKKKREREKELVSKVHRGPLYLSSGRRREREGEERIYPLNQTHLSLTGRFLSLFSPLSNFGDFLTEKEKTDNDRRSFKNSG